MTLAGYIGTVSVNILTSAFQPPAGKPILHSAGIDSVALTLSQRKIGHAAKSGLWVEEAPAATKSTSLSTPQCLIVQLPMLLHQPRSHQVILA